MPIPKTISQLAALGLALLLCLGVCPASAARTGQAQIKLDSDNVVLDADAISRLNVRSVSELLNLVPGVKAGESSVTIRGSYKVRVLMDGMPLNDPGSHTIKLNLVPFQSLKKVEVFKGGGGVAFGDDASGGAVLFTTQAPERTTAFAEVAAGNRNAVQTRLGLTASQGRWGLGLDGEYKNGDGYRVNDDKEVKRGGFKVSYRPEAWGRGRTPTLAVDFSEQRSGSAGYPQFPTPRARLHDEALGASLNWERWQVTSGTYFTRFQNESINPDRDQHSLLRTWAFKQDLRRPWRPWGIKGLVAGLSAEVVEGQGSELATRQEQSLAGFARQETMIEAWKLGVALGLRGSWYSDFDGVLNPELEIYRDFGRHRVKAAATRSNNLPTFRQRYYRHSTLEPNPDLGMERATNFSLGLASAWRKDLSGDVAVFHRLVEDAITYVLGDGGVGQYRNLGETVTNGVDASLKWRAASWLELTPSYTYLQAKDAETDLWLAAKPEHKFSLDALLRPAPGWAVGLLYTYESKRFTRSDNTEWTDPYHKVDLRCEYRQGPYRFFATVENLLDEDYDYGDGLPAPPRLWLVGVRREF
ncbi:MAG: TonB-dependent receptor [Thermodesulfobacteriota bacterium]